MAQKPSIPKGTRDFIPAEMARRNYIFDTIREVFTLYGYSPIETPAMENLSTLLGKYGEEGDKLLFRILNSGDFLSKTDRESLPAIDPVKLSTQICDRGLRYDLTVPFARFVVQHQHEISFPFKRYQIQPVWRADRPQKGRYREFYQCDADVVGSDSLLNELELIQIVDEVFTRLDVSVTIKINNRKLLTGIAEVIGAANKIVDITVAIDKLDKIGLEKVNEELQLKGLSPEQIERLQPLFSIQGDTHQKLDALARLLEGTEAGMKGINEVRELMGMVERITLENQLELDLTLARGLNYYTGAIIEVKANDVKIGSICGGGRYDDLTGIFGMKDMSGVGVSFGADRIYDVLLQLDNFPRESIKGTRVLFINFGEKEIAYCLPIVANLRKQGVACELYPEPAKMKKQMGYANSRNIPYVVMAGENEIKDNTVTLKDMENGVQHVIPANNLLGMLTTG
ncbi:MAG: histidine--tRNA ligase [Bacteroidota bacterium]